MKRVYLLILYYNGFDDMRLCLPTLKNFRGENYSLHTVVINNGSSPDQSQRLKTLLKKYPSIKLLENGKNLGFAAGNNVGIRYALKKNADYVVLLNNDTQIEDDFIQRGIILNADIISPVVKFREFVGKKKMIYDLGGTVNRWTGRTGHVNAYYQDYLKYKKIKPLSVDYVAGCSIMIKSSVLEKIGLLDERYFIYFEDVDYCVSAKKAGFSVLVDPSSVLYHKLGGSMDRWSLRAIYFNLTSNYIFIAKHLELRMITGFVYLTILTAKIAGDYIMDYVRGKRYIQLKRKWQGAKYTYREE